jgi:hypothetical protein
LNKYPFWPQLKQLDQGLDKFPEIRNPFMKLRFLFPWNMTVNDGSVEFGSQRFNTSLEDLPGNEDVTIFLHGFSIPLLD